MAPPKDYRHPFTPYPIQVDFMNAVHNCIEGGKVGIFESPTGTGKSLSLICGSLTWLREHKRQLVEQQLAADVADDDEPAWMLEHAKAEKRRQVLQRRNEMNERLAKVRAKEEKARQRFERGEPPTKRPKTSVVETENPGDEEAQFLLDDYESDDGSSTSTKPRRLAGSDLSSETQALIDRLGDSLKTFSDSNAEDVEDEAKVIFCSRTHSQLGQFVNELRRVKMAPSLPPDPSKDQQLPLNEQDILIEDFKHLILGSRKNLCINPKVNKLGSVTAINERCLELQQSSTPKEAKCKFIPNPEREALVNDFRDHALAKIRDIEDLGHLGERIGICPYYASRAAIKPSEIVSLPYPLLLQKSAREALGLSVKGHVVIVDEAHNLIDTISDLHSVSVTLSHFKRARLQLTAYLQKFRNKLKGKNRVCVTQLVRLIDSLVVFLDSKQKGSSRESEGIVQIGDLMAGKGVDQINLYKLMYYFHESKLARKVDGYTDYTSQQSDQPKNGSDKARSHVPVLTQIQSFMLALTYPSAEGRFFYSKPEHGITSNDDMVLKYRLLDPTHHFKEIVEQARAVILAGGTMSPMEDYTTHLLNYLPRDQIQTLSCGHIIPRNNLLALPVTCGSRGDEFKFTYESRNSQSMIQELGRAILECAKVVPDGLVVFFPSYAYLSIAIKTWQSPNDTTSIWSRISAVKRIFMEKSSNTSTTDESKAPSIESNGATAKHQRVDQVLADYTAHIYSPSNTQGALLLAIVGGSLSEGINFADRLGRGIIVVGLPFPNLHSPEWKAKLEFVEKRATSSTERRNAAQEFYINACMRAVNQSMGRAIRHKDDYAAIMLFDQRYNRAGIQSKLPAWIRESLVDEGSRFESVMGRLRDFFQQKANVTL